MVLNLEGTPSPEVLDLIAERFRALAEPVRLQILMVLAKGERTVGEVVEATGCKQANVSKHLGLLLDEGLVARRKDGMNAWYRIADPSVLELCSVVCRSVEKRIDSQQRALSTFTRR